MCLNLHLGSHDVPGGQPVVCEPLTRNQSWAPLLSEKTAVSKLTQSSPSGALVVQFVSALADRWGCSQGPCCVEEGEVVCAGSFFSGAEAVVIGSQCSPWAHGTASSLA